MKENYDVKCYELAEAFLQSTPSLDSEAARHELSGVIQQAVEDWYFNNPPIGEPQPLPLPAPPVAEPIVADKSEVKS